MKVKYTLYTLYTKLGVVMFKREEKKAIVMSNVKNEEHIQLIIDHVLLLLNVYQEVKKDFNSLYSVIIEEEKTVMYRTNIFSLKEEVPKLFVSGYARECFIKPTIITDLEED